MPLLDLPTELLLEIGNSLQPAHMLALSCVNRFFQSVFLPLLYKTNVLHWKSSALIWGARHGAHHTVKRILDHHDAEVNTQDQDSRTAIFHAVENQNEAILDMLLNDARSNVNCHDREWQTPLLYALSHGKSSMACRLLKHHSTSITAEDSMGRTALWYAIASREECLIQQLLEKGSSVDVPDIKGFSPLSVAIHQGNISLLRQPLSCMARCGQHGRGFSDHDDSIPLLCLAVRKGRGKIARLLLAYGADVNSRDIYQRSPLHIAVSNGDLRNTAMLLNWDGVELNATDFLGRTALQIAAELGHNVIFKLLLNQAGVDINAVDPDQRTVLHEASKIGNILMVELLLRITEVNPNARDADGATALCLAQDKQVKQLILARGGVDVNAVGQHQTGALHHAVKEADFSTARILLQHAELNPNQTDEMDWTPLCHATHNGDLAMVELLLTRADIDVNNSTPSPLFIAARDGYIQILNRLIRVQGVNLHKGWCGESPLEVSANKNHCEIVRVLLEQHRKQDPSVSTRLFIRALSIAMKRGHSDLIRLLLDTQSSNKTARSHLQNQ
jgi:ankyrin repeat protein